jgi:hypothetical protein
MKELVPDGSTWQGQHAVGVPFRLIIKKLWIHRPGREENGCRFVDLIQEIGARGCPVEIITEK